MLSSSLFRILSFLILFWSFIYNSYAQKYTTADSIEIYRLLDKADDEDLTGNLSAATRFIQKALKLSQDKKMQRGEGYALLKLADLRMKSNEENDLEAYYQKAITIGQKIKDPMLTGLAYLQKSQKESNSDNYTTAEKYLKDALPYFITANETHYIALTYNQLGFIAENSGHYEEAVNYNLKAISLFEKGGSIKETANTLGNQAIIYYKLGKKEDALKMFKQSAERRETIQDVKGLAATYGNIFVVYLPVNEDSARKYLDLQLFYAEKSGAALNKAQAYENAANILNRDKKYAEAIEFEKKAIDIYTSLDNKQKLTYRYLNVAGLYNHLNDSIEAENYYAKAEEIAKNLNNKPLLQNFYLNRSNFYKGRSNYENALLNNTLYYTYRDSIIDEKTKTNIAELQEKYDAEKKDHEISRLKTEEKIKQLQLERQHAIIKGNVLEAEKKENEIILLNQEQDLKDKVLKNKEAELSRLALIAKTNEQEKLLKEKESERQRLMLFILAGSFSAIAILSFVLLRQYRLRQKYEQQQKLLEVRNAISKDLHDEIGSTLTSINILSNVSQQAIARDPEQAKEMLSQITQQSKAIQQNMSDIVWAIRPENDKIENLEIRMREYVAQTLEPLNISTQIHFNKRMSQDTLPQNYRKDILLIFKEAINNIVKHSNATEVKIDFIKSDQNVQLVIQDNGRWKQNGHSISSGTGTKSMEQRAQNNGGYLSIDKETSKITMTIPIP